jgi:hypothetical protein
LEGRPHHLAALKATGRADPPAPARPDHFRGIFEIVPNVIDPTRSGAVAGAVLGLDCDGTMIHDGWSPYDQFKNARHQQCLRHTIRTQSLGFSSQRRFVQARSPRGPVRLRRCQGLRLRPAQGDHVADLQRVLPYDDALDE